MRSEYHLSYFSTIKVPLQLICMSIAHPRRFWYIASIRLICNATSSEREFILNVPFFPYVGFLSVDWIGICQWTKLCSIHTCVQSLCLEDQRLQMARSYEIKKITQCWPMSPRDNTWNHLLDCLAWHSPVSAESFLSRWATLYA